MGAIHPEPHELAGQTVRINDDVPEIGGADYRIKDWWDRVSGGSWMDAEGNPACLVYALRSAIAGLPLDNEVVYGKVGGLGHLVHVSQIATPAEAEQQEAARR